MSEVTSYEIENYKNIRVGYLPHLDGGGRGFGQEFIRVVREKIGKVNHIFEFCAGPGFIGFSLMAHGLCNKLTLADVNPEAVRTCQHTIDSNNLGDKVSVYLSDCLDSIPETEQWDLVVSNPPHFFTPSQEIYKADIRRYDPNFLIHKKYYKDISRFLKPDGISLIQENSRATSYKDFTPMIEESGLEIVEVFHARVMSLGECRRERGRIGFDNKISPFYFIWSQKVRND